MIQFAAMRLQPERRALPISFLRSVLPLLFSWLSPLQLNLVLFPCLSLLPLNPFLAEAKTFRGLQDASETEVPNTSATLQPEPQDYFGGNSNEQQTLTMTTIIDEEGGYNGTGTPLPATNSVWDGNTTTSAENLRPMENSESFLPPLDDDLGLEPARISCSALYSTACARTDSQWLATVTARNLTRYLTDHKLNVSSEQVWRDVNDGRYNMETGFYPFVFELESGRCVAHGEGQFYVGWTLQEILDHQGNGFSDGQALLERFRQAAEQGGAWVQHLWQDAGKMHAKLTFVVQVTPKFILGVGYSTEPLPADVPCSAHHDGWCSITNTLSLVGKAQLRLQQAETVAQFESVMYDISFDEDEYQIPDGFYIFMYHYDGRLKAHGRIHDHFDDYSYQIIEDHGLGTREDGIALHEDMIRAAEGSGWLQYQWKNAPTDPTTFTKIAFVVKITFGNDDHILGVGYTFDRGQSAGSEHWSPSTNLPSSFRAALELSSHVLSYVISSPLPMDEIWHAISHDAQFRMDDFYAYVVDFNGTTVAHGFIPSFTGVHLSQTVLDTGMVLDDPPSIEKFSSAAREGGGWIIYDWGTPGAGPNGTDITFKKVAYVFQMTMHGRSYVGGVGFTNLRAPISPYAEEGSKMNGEPIPCSQNYLLNCSEVNTQAILGQALADLTLATTSFHDNTIDNEMQVDSVLKSISSRNSAYRVNDFYVAVFSVDGSVCDIDDGSGCCIAHGEDPTLVGRSWQQILDVYGITSIDGDDLHRDLMILSNSNTGGYLDYPWSREFGDARTKRAITSKYKNNENSYYVIAEYFKTPQPPTCDSCPVGLECTREFQSYCEPIPDEEDNPLEWIIALSSLLLISLILFYWVRHRNWVKRQILDGKIKAMEQEIQGMVEICQDTGAQLSSAQRYFEKFGMVGDHGRGTTRPHVDVFWYWEEDAAQLQNHDSAQILPGTTFVRYADEVSIQLEDAYQLCLKVKGYYETTLDLTNVASQVHNSHTGLKYLIDFEEMVQANPITEHKRAIRREEASIQLDEELANRLPPLPADIDFFGPNGEDFLPTFKGQVIQVSKEHPTQPWIYGSVLYDPLLDAAQDNPQAATGLNQILSNALHDRPTSGWFPKALTVAADVKVMQNLLVTLGGEGVKNLKPPATWDQKDGIIPVAESSPEYDEVVHYFLAALHDERDNVDVLGVERIQSIPLWQSYAVKKQTMKTRDNRNPSNLVNNRDLNGLERKWLFHGTDCTAIPQIVKQGFNRAFAGRNAVVYGKGVYFARDASYSSHHAYSRPDSAGIQRMFMCRVAVGDWCQGSEGMLTPAAKPNNNLELFDTTVDNEANPSVFVVYHDAQAYPDYLVSFHRND